MTRVTFNFRSSENAAQICQYNDNQLSVKLQATVSIMKICCLHATAGPLKFRQQAMSKLFESQREAVDSSAATATACELLLGRATIDTYRTTLEVKKR